MVHARYIVLLRVYLLVLQTRQTLRLLLPRSVLHLLQVHLLLLILHSRPQLPQDPHLEASFLLLQLSRHLKCHWKQRR